MPLQLRNGTFGTSSADCDVIRAKFFRFFSRILGQNRALSPGSTKKGGVISRLRIPYCNSSLLMSHED